MLHREARNNAIHGIKVARGAPQITHLQFADDSLLFTRANQQEAGIILNILLTYQQASGQVVSMEKSEASFSRNVLDEAKEMICQRMGVKIVESHARYLGFPIVFGR